MHRCNNTMRVFGLILGLGTILGACAEYLDRRDGISLTAGNAIASNKVTQMVDPWPRESANRNIAFNGEKMQSAVERYRRNRVVPPRGIGTAASYQPSATNPDPGAGGGAAPAAPGGTPPAASTK
jgi:hypothetical protein